MNARAAALRETHEQFRASIVQAAELTGWRCYWSWRSYHSPAGWPDLVLVRPPRLIFAELKTARSPKLTPDQEATLGLLALVPGVETYIWRTPDDWQSIIDVLRGVQ